MRYRLIIILFLIITIDLVGFGIIIPILPVLFIKTQFHAQILQNLFPNTPQQFLLYGAMVAAYPLFQFFSAPILGQFSDKYGRKNILLLCLVATACSYLLSVVGIRMISFSVLLFSRVLGGLMGGNIAIVQAAAADATEHKDRTKVYGILGAAFGIGFIFGPYVGGKLSDPSIVHWFSLDTPFLVAGLLSAIAVIITWLFLPETHPHEKRNMKIRFSQSVRDIRDAFTHRRLNALFFIGFLFQFAFTMFVSFFGVLLFSRYQFTQVTIGEYFAFTGIWIALTQVFFTKIVSTIYGNKKMLAAGLLGCSLMTFLLLMKFEVWTLYVITAVFAILNGLTQTGVVSLISINAGSSSQGKIFGINASLFALAQSFPPVVSGIIATAYNLTTPLLIAGSIMALSFLFYLIQYRSIHE